MTNLAERQQLILADSELTEKQLIEKHGGERGIWGQHPIFKVADWQSEVDNDDTRASYWGWVVSQIEQEAMDINDQIEHSQAEHSDTDESESPSA